MLEPGSIGNMDESIGQEKLSGRVAKKPCRTPQRADMGNAQGRRSQVLSLRQKCHSLHPQHGLELYTFSRNPKLPGDEWVPLWETRDLTGMPKPPRMIPVNPSVRRNGQLSERNVPTVLMRPTVVENLVLPLKHEMNWSAMGNSGVAIGKKALKRLGLRPEQPISL